MLLLRNSLLSHLSPSLLSKMSVAVLAALAAYVPSQSATAADNSVTVANIVSSTKAANSLVGVTALTFNAATPENAAIASASYAAMLNATSTFSNAVALLPTIPEAQSNSSANFAIASSAQLIAMSTMQTSSDINALIASSITEAVSNAASQADRAFEDVATGVKSPSNKDELTIRAEQMTGRPSRVLNFDGQVEMVRGPSTIDARTAEYHGVEDLVMANGDVQMFRDRDCYTGDTLEMQMDTGQGFLTNPVYQIAKNNAQGSAQRMNFVDSERSEIENGTYTTCQGTKPDWYMLSSRLDLDTGRDEGVAYDGVVYFKDVPILAAPWMSFPISDARRSGLLPPEFYSTTAGGPEITIPYYFDIAPNRDATIYPTYIEKRGEELGGEFRYLDADYSGMTHAEITPSDQDDNGMMRYSISSTHHEILMPGLVMDINYNRASDNQYAIDYSHSITASSQHLLPQAFNLNYAKSIWNFDLNMTNYQVLQDANNDITKPYEIMPRLSAGATKIDNNGFDWSIYTEYTNFLNSLPNTVYGERLVAEGQLSYPITGTYYFVTPKILYHTSQYKLEPNNGTYVSSYTFGPGNIYTPVNTLYGREAGFSVPTFSLDSGLYFERNADWLGHDLTQTLEPRLFYVRTPYRDQTDVPIFDTGIADINFAQIFSENRFSGQDRVGDANQLTAALVTRAIEMDGQERMRFAIAQRMSFQQPVVVDVPAFTPTLFNGQPAGASLPTLPSRSDLLFAASGKLTDTLTLDAGWQYSESFQSTQQMNYGFKWQPGPMQVINAEYRFQQVSEVDPEGMKQIDVSAQWPIAPRWYAVARSNFSVQDHRVLDGLAGFEYKQDCWIFRLVAQRYLVPSTVAGITSSSTTSLFFQLELNGLSKIGSNPLEVLKRSISGYQPLNQPTTQQGYQQNNF